MKIRIGKTYHFEAAHHLPYHDGKCARQHGHSYTLGVTVEGVQQSTGPKRGMVLDYADLDTLVQRHVLDVLDHHDLNDASMLRLTFGKYCGDATTAENIAEWCFETLRAAASVRVYSVCVRETDRSWAEVIADDDEY